MTSSRLSARNAAAVSYARNTKAATTAIAFTDRRSQVAPELPAVFGIHRLRAAQNCFRWNVVLLGELIHERILSGQVVGHDSSGFRGRQFRDRFTRGRDTIA